MAFIKVVVALCAALCLTQAQFTPGAVPVCPAPGRLLPHPTYCQLFYICISADTAPVEMQCGANTVFDASKNTCNFADIPNAGLCANWVCDSRRYPDICCDKYWECNANRWTQESCPVGQTFDMASGQCLASTTTQCVQSSQCPSTFVNNPSQDVCTLTENPSDPDRCTYYHAGNLMQCNAEMQFNQATCGCHDRAPAGMCRGFPYAANKGLDTGCRASFRTQFDNSATLTAYSDKVNLLISPALTASGANLQNGGGFYLGAKGAVSVSGNEALLASNGYIYANYFANNEMHAPVAFVVEFRPSSFRTGDSFELLSNTFSFENQVCANSLTVSVRNDGPTNVNLGSLNDYRYTFSVALSGKTALDQDVVANIPDLTIVVPQSVVTGIQESGSPANYLRFLLTLSGATATAQVAELNGNLNTQFANTASRTAAFAIDHLRRTMCGLTVGSSMTGSVRGFTVYEGCGNGFAGLISN